MFEDLMKIDKRSAKILDRAISGGLEGTKDIEELAKKFDLDPNNPVFRTVEGYANVSQKIMLVKYIQLEILQIMNVYIIFTMLLEMMSQLL